MSLYKIYFKRCMQSMNWRCALHDAGLVTASSSWCSAVACLTGDSAVNTDWPAEAVPHVGNRRACESENSWIPPPDLTEK